jgi:hypothetical protein
MSFVHSLLLNASSLMTSCVNGKCCERAKMIDNDHEYDDVICDDGNMMM